MRRLMVLLVCGGVLWFGYDWYVGDSLAGTKPESDVGLAGAAPVTLEPGGGVVDGDPPDTAPAEGTRVPLERRAPAQTGASSDPVVARLVEGLRVADPTAAAQALPTLAKTTGEDRKMLLDAVLTANRSATPEQRVALLGRNNTFLHMEEGRRLARQAILAASEQKAEVAVRTFTTLIEACMRGRIHKGDTQARAVVDEAYEAMQIPLRRTVLSPAHVARARTYQVKSGDVLDRIARHFRKQGYAVDSGTIAAFNRITDPRRLQVGQVVKVPVDPILTVVEKHSFLQAVYVGNVIFRLYWIGHGKQDRTPEATFTVGAKQKHPDWYGPNGVVPYGHPDNLLGDYFVKFQHASLTGFGIHGTSEPETIGMAASAGCIRMADADIEDFFQIVPPGSKVEIRANR